MNAWKARTAELSPGMLVLETLFLAILFYGLMQLAGMHAHG
ncbi:hypothetical protein [Polaromonas sp. JS666]|nr:hypothetical protein [Polaromonas sp. JS666]